MKLEEVWEKLDKDDRVVIFASLFAALDIHPPVDSLTQEQYERLDELSNFTNSQNYD